MSVTLVLFVAAAVSALVQATIGVGFALIMVPVAAVLRPELLPGGIILLMLPLNAWVAWRERTELDRSGTGWTTGGRFLGGFAGIGVLAVLSRRGLDVLIGASTLMAVTASVLAPRFRPGRGAFATAGFVTGVTETTTGIGGPPLALVFQHHTPAALRSTLATCFLIGEVLSIVLLAVSGSLDGRQLGAAVVLCPAVVVGVVSSGPARGLFDARRLRSAVLVFAFVSAVWIMIRAL